MNTQKDDNGEKIIEESQHRNSKSLPPKKRYQFEAKAEEDKRENPMEKHIVAGVIRHNSSPNHCTGYIYKVTK